MIEHITYKGDKLPVRVGYRVLKYIKSETGQEVSKALNERDLEVIEKILYYALQSGFKGENKKFEFNEEDMEDILDECLSEILPIIHSSFPNMMALVTTEQISPAEQEKEQVQMKKESKKKRKRVK